MGGRVGEHVPWVGCLRVLGRVPEREHVEGLRGCAVQHGASRLRHLHLHSTAACIDGRLEGKPQDFVTAAAAAAALPLVAAARTLLRLHCGVWWPALHCRAEVGLRWVVAAPWSPPPPRACRGHHYGRCGATAGSHRQEGCGSARPPAPPRKTRSTAVGCRSGQTAPQPARRGHSETRLPEAGGSGRPSRSDLGFACGLRG